ncbi:site-specific DNA-methyltransferase [Acidobacteria bacterium AH-259-G07]|nr:site-specific DNA-methyltransferase [Acidobacteria bacterium AH-259-G07]
MPKLKSIDKEARNNHKRIVALKKETTRSFILLGKELKRNNERRYFGHLGYSTFEAYIESPAVNLGRRSVYSLIAIYETFIEELGYSLDKLSTVDYSKLDRVLPIINVQPVAHRKWFEKAKTLPRKALEKEVRLAQKRHDRSRPKPLSLAVPKKHKHITADSEKECENPSDYRISGSGDLETNRIYQGEALEVLRTFPDECVDCIVTSPPYYGLRDYGIEGQLGLEKTFDEFLEKMLAITRELKRVLKRTGTLWWNHGDSYGTGSGSGIRSGKQATNRGTQNFRTWQEEGKPAIKGLEKCLLLQPYRLAQRMIDEQGWILRNIIIWHKPNCMPSSVKDRFTVDFEPILFLTKSRKYWFQMQYEPVKKASIERLNRAVSNKNKWINGPDGQTKHTLNQARPNIKDYKRYEKSNAPHEFVGPDHLVSPFDPAKGRNKRCVWKIPTRPFKEAHFAVYPPKLIETPIKAGCPKFICRNCKEPRKPIYRNTKRQHSIGATSGAYLKERNFKGDNTVRNMSVKTCYSDCGCMAGWDNGIVLDPFMGAGTTALVALEFNRRFIGIELNPEYVEIAHRRIKPFLQKSKLAAS